MEIFLVLRLKVCGLKDGYRTTLPVVVGYHAGEQVSLSIGELQLFAVLHAKHLHDVLAGIFIQYYLFWHRQQYLLYKNEVP